MRTAPLKISSLRMQMSSCREVAFRGVGTKPLGQAVVAFWGIPKSYLTPRRGESANPLDNMSVTIEEWVVRV